MHSVHRFASAAPSGLVRRLLCPFTSSPTVSSSSVRGLTNASDGKAPTFTITRNPSRLPKRPAPSKRADALLPRKTPPNRTQVPSLLRAEDKDSGETSKLKTSGKLLSARLGSGAQKGYIALQYEGIEDHVLVSTLWLRDSCTCPQCVTPSSGQKTFHTHDVVSAEVREVSVIEQPESLERTTLRVVWVPTVPASQASDATAVMSEQEHVSMYDSKTLLQTFAECHVSQYPLDLPRRLWDRRTIEKALKPVSYADWMAPDNGSNAEFYRGLLDLYQLGILIVDGVPDSETAVRGIANQIGAIQTTFYGELFDVVSKPNAENVAYTNVFLCLHQDLLYMNDPPYIQLLHCLRNECDGGESLFCDSVRAAVEMQSTNEEHTLALSKRPVAYHYERNGHYYYNKRPVFELEGSRGISRAIVKHTAWSPPFQDSFRYPVYLDSPTEKNTLANPDISFRKWAAAAKAFSDQLEHPDNMFEVKLQAGQCVLFNNRRVLHGRRQFNTSEGTRWLKGTYVDEQTFHSRVTDMLRRGVNGTEPVRRCVDSLRLSEQEQVLKMSQSRMKEVKVDEG
ncbi:hypothetical protein SEPCBS57363_002572 [Sporothrix epigloea]|uniref:TauD/TfdA-like domain-containing protein n=1 Tax=Sporothrix epigloea TaxID=1892477 RepID=A0ABP0DGL7_9PEZI